MDSLWKTCIRGLGRDIWFYVLLVSFVTVKANQKLKACFPKGHIGELP